MVQLLEELACLGVSPGFCLPEVGSWDCYISLLLRDPPTVLTSQPEASRRGCEEEPAAPTPQQHTALQFLRTLCPSVSFCGHKALSPPGPPLFSLSLTLLVYQPMISLKPPSLNLLFGRLGSMLINNAQVLFVSVQVPGR